MFTYIHNVMGESKNCSKQPCSYIIHMVVRKMAFRSAIKETIFGTQAAAFSSRPALRAPAAI